jgi:hypothetical protein
VTTATGSINDLQFRDEVEDGQVPSDGKLPEISSYVPNLPPAKYVVKIPENIAQLITLKDHQEEEGGPVKQRVILKFDKNNPVVIMGGEHNEHPLTGYVSNIPRPRGKEKIPVSDMAYYLVDACGLQVNPRTPKEWVDAVARTGGLLVPIEVGLQARCDVERDVYVDEIVSDPLDPSKSSVTSKEVPGLKGCGKRYYTRDFYKGGAYQDRIPCTGQRKMTDPATGQEITVGCGASIRGFNQIERWLKRDGPSGR